MATKVVAGKNAGVVCSSHTGGTTFWLGMFYQILVGKVVGIRYNSWFLCYGAKLKRVT